MTGIKRARIRKCLKCEKRSTRHATIDTWPRCAAMAGEYLDNAFLEDGVCPLGRWESLKPVDIEAEAAAALVKSIEKETESIKKLIDILSPTEKTAKTIRPKLEALVAANVIRHADTAKAIEEYVDARAISGNN